MDPDSARSLRVAYGTCDEEDFLRPPPTVGRISTGMRDCLVLKTVAPDLGSASDYATKGGRASGLPDRTLHRP